MRKEQEAYELGKNPDNIEKWRQEWNNALELIRANTQAKGVYGGFSKGLCPYLQFVRLDALNKEDWPHNINDNSIYIQFEVDLLARKVWIHQSGSVYLSPKDKATPQYKYYAMRGMLSIAEEKGAKKFRKQGFKDVADLQKKMENYFRGVIQAVAEYTGGYPYKQGIEQPETLAA